jgi:glycosyltransferase involved in cell wall biosynthesis
MRVLHANNVHRGLGGVSRAVAATVDILRAGGIQVDLFQRDSAKLPATLAGRATAFVSGLYASSAVRAFRAALRELRPDVVHVHELYPLISPWILPQCASEAIPVVMSSYDYRLSCPIATHYVRGEECHRCVGGREHWCVVRNCRGSLPESLAYALRNASARRFGLFEGHVARFLPVSRHLGDFLERHSGIEPSRIAVVPPPVRVPSTPVEDPSRGAYVAYAGRFAPEKGIAVLVEACRHAGLPMRFAGDAPAHAAVREDDDAAFVMTRSAEELAQFYRGARVVVMPSTWSETFGVVAAEAMSHGVPVVVSRIGALTETVVEGVTGLYANPGDARDLARQLRRVWDDAALARELGRNGRKRIEETFSDRMHFERLSRVYGEVCGASAPIKR